MEPSKGFVQCFHTVIKVNTQNGVIEPEHSHQQGLPGSGSKKKLSCATEKLDLTEMTVLIKWESVNIK